MATETVNVDSTAIKALITAEATTRASDDAALASSIASEASTRASADTALSGAIASGDAASVATAAADATTKANAAQSAAISAAATDATTKANAAQAAAIAASQPLDSDLTAYANAADAAARRALIGAGTGTGNGDALTSNPLSQFAATTSGQLAGVMSDETGTGSLVFAISPTLVTPSLGTPSALVATNVTGTASGLTAGTVTTNANLTGPVTSTGNATAIADAALSIAKTSGLQAALTARHMVIPLTASAAVTWTDMPSAVTFLNGQATRAVYQLDLTGYTQCRIVVVTAGTAAAGTGRLAIKYKTGAYSTTVGDYSDIGTGATEVAASVTTAITQTDSGWITITAAALADVQVAVVGLGSNGTNDPVFGNIAIHFR